MVRTVTSIGVAVTSRCELSHKSVQLSHCSCWFCISNKYFELSLEPHIRIDMTDSRTRVLKTYCVYCGSATGKNPNYTDAASALGEEMSRRELKLVYGGGSIGLMGTIARSFLKSSKKESVIGIIPRHLAPVEITGEMVGNTIVVETMHERKVRISSHSFLTLRVQMLMHEMSDAFIALPGGLGTLDELLEAMTWLAIDLHSKPIGLLNVDNYFDKLIEFLDYQVKEGFVDPKAREFLVVAETPQELLTKLEEVPNNESSYLETVIHTNSSS